MIDLHAHTTASDGELSPEALVQRAHAAGVTHLAVTDHDTIASVDAATEAARALGLTLIAGIEVSAFHERREVHILGHFVNAHHPDLIGFSARLKTERLERMEAMVAKMQGLGFPITLEDVLAIAGDAQLGRPHLALVIVNKGYCTSTKEAFSRFLGDGRPAHVDRFKLSAEDAIRLIRTSGGSATLAHPSVSRMERYDVERLHALGLAGLEVHHADHNPSVKQKYLGIARALDLVPTAGSDFHGPRVAPDRHLGTTGQMPFSDLERLEARAHAKSESF